MRFSLIHEDTYRLSHMDLLFAEFLKQLPFEGDPGSDKSARGRLFSSPMENVDNEEDEQLVEDWKNYVTPELEHLFESARETVNKDLQSIEKMDQTELQDVAAQLGADNLPPLFALDFPRTHRDAWLSALNQARLVLAEKYGWSHEEIDEDEEDDAFESLLEEPDEAESLEATEDPDQAPFAHRKRLAILQMHVYGLLQELLVEDFRQETEDPTPFASPEDLEEDEDADEDDTGETEE